MFVPPVQLFVAAQRHRGLAPGLHDGERPAASRCECFAGGSFRRSVRVGTEFGVGNDSLTTGLLAALRLPLIVILLATVCRRLAAAADHIVCPGKSSAAVIPLPRLEKKWRVGGHTRPLKVDRCWARPSAIAAFLFDGPAWPSATTMVPRCPPSAPPFPGQTHRPCEAAHAHGQRVRFEIERAGDPAKRQSGFPLISASSALKLIVFLAERVELSHGLRSN